MRGAKVAWLDASASTYACHVWHKNTLSVYHFEWVDAQGRCLAMRQGSDYVCPLVLPAIAYATVTSDVQTIGDTAALKPSASQQDTLMGARAAAVHVPAHTHADGTGPNLPPLHANCNPTCCWMCASFSLLLRMTWPSLLCSGTYS